MWQHEEPEYHDADRKRHVDEDRTPAEVFQQDPESNGPTAPPAPFAPDHKAKATVRSFGSENSDETSASVEEPTGPPDTHQGTRTDQ